MTGLKVNKVKNFVKQFRVFEVAILKNLLSNSLLICVSM